MSIINNILLILERKKLSQTDLCNTIKVNPSTMTNWKTRNTDPPSKYIIPICEFLDVTPEYLLTGKEANSDKQIGAGIIHTGNVTNSNIIGGHDNKVSGNNITSDNDKSNDSLNCGVYSELINYLEALSASKRRHAMADLMDILEENYPL